MPDDGAARSAVEEWLAGGAEAILRVDELDLRGLDLSGVEVFETWAMNSDFRGCRLAATDIGGARLYRSDFRDAEMSGIVMPNADAERADFSRAHMSRANLRNVEAPDSHFTATVLSGAEIGGGFVRADFRGADLRRASLLTLDLRSAALSEALVEKATGTVLGPFVADLDDVERLVGGLEAEQWFATRGASVEVLTVP